MTDVSYSYLAHVCPSIRHQHLWSGRSRRLQWLPSRRAEWHSTDNVEPRRCRPIGRKHVRSFHFRTESQVNVTLFSYGSHPFYLEHRWVPSTNRLQSHGVFLSRCALPFCLLFFLSLIVSSRAQRCGVGHHPRVTAVLEPVFDPVPYYRWHARSVLLLRPGPKERH